MPGLSANIQPVKMRFSDAVELLFVDLDERRRLRLFGRRARIAGARRHPERAERHRFVELDLEFRNARRDLVERGKDGDMVFDSIGAGRACRAADDRQSGERQRATAAKPAAAPFPKRSSAAKAKIVSTADPLERSVRSRQLAGAETGRFSDRRNSTGGRHAL